MVDFFYASSSSIIFGFVPFGVQYTATVNEYGFLCWLWTRCSRVWRQKALERLKIKNGMAFLAQMRNIQTWEWERQSVHCCCCCCCRRAFLFHCVPRKVASEFDERIITLGTNCLFRWSYVTHLFLAHSYPLWCFVSRFLPHAHIDADTRAHMHSAPPRSQLLINFMQLFMSHRSNVIIVRHRRRSYNNFCALPSIRIFLFSLISLQLALFDH